MTVHTTTIERSTKGDNDIHDLTPDLRSAIIAAGISDGIAVAFVPGSTAAITTIEHEPGLLRDLDRAFNELAERDRDYAHNHGGDSNGHAHVRAAIVGPSVSVPVVGGEPSLGTWQQVVLVDFDERPRSRRVLIQVLGDEGR